ncbi:MAG: hypothetical protein LBS68_02210 [Puniceicoccales bacterium]|jgi:hypothetical protein|nr:hypothetical protein [Puniceicoccales bacterium]
MKREDFLCQLFATNAVRLSNDGTGSSYETDNGYTLRLANTKMPPEVQFPKIKQLKTCYLPGDRRGICSAENPVHLDIEIDKYPNLEEVNGSSSGSKSAFVEVRFTGVSARSAGPPTAPSRGTPPVNARDARNPGLDITLEGVTKEITFPRDSKKIVSYNLQKDYNLVVKFPNWDAVPEEAHFSVKNQPVYGGAAESEYFQICVDENPISVDIFRKDGTGDFIAVEKSRDAKPLIQDGWKKIEPAAGKSAFDYGRLILRKQNLIH